ncbi:transposase [Microvirga sp. Mcv34]|uniref:transposase n=1 Tax=Microvirga sp. Mcv34 TaxID=2926016 RepID=UPI0021C6CF11|nr:transposase [Microvirga sp. Mcv34]
MDLLQALLDQSPDKTMYVAWGNASTHEEVKVALRGAADRPMLHYLPTTLGALENLIAATGLLSNLAIAVPVECAPS